MSSDNDNDPMEDVARTLAPGDSWHNEFIGIHYDAHTDHAALEVRLAQLVRFVESTCPCAPDTRPYVFQRRSPVSVRLQIQVACTDVEFGAFSLTLHAKLVELGLMPPPLPPTIAAQ